MNGILKKVFALGMSAVIIAGAFAGCGDKATEDTTAQDTTAQTQTEDTTATDTTVTAETTADGEKVLTFGCAMYSDGTVNSAYDENSGWNAMRYGITEALFKFDDEMVAQPWLAESYTVNDEHTEWVITLKEGIKFSDGCDLTPSKVAAYFDFLFTEGAEGTAQPNRYLDPEAVITADDAANTLTIVTPNSVANLPGQLAHPTMAIQDVEHITDLTNGAIGTGLYKIDEFLGVGVGYNMVANEYYYEDVPYDRVEIRFMGDASAKTMALQSGQIDLAENVTNVTDLATFDADPNYTLVSATGVRCAFSLLNFNGVLGNDALRKAVIMAVDGETICNSNTIGGLYTAGYSVLPSSLDYGYDELENPTAYNPEAAMALLDEAGIVDTDGDGIRELDGENINLRMVSYENRLMNELTEAQSQYLNEIGLGTTLDFTTSDDHKTKRTAGEYDILIGNWTTVSTGDPYAYFANWQTDTNASGYSNAEYDALYAQLEGELDSAKRAEIFFQLQQILIDDAVNLIGGYYHSSIVYSSNVASANIHTADYYWLSTEITPTN